MAIARVALRNDQRRQLCKFRPPNQINRICHCMNAFCTPYQHGVLCWAGPVVSTVPTSAGPPGGDQKRRRPPGQTQCRQALCQACDDVGGSRQSDYSSTGDSDAHESSILAEVLGLASIFLPRNRLALLEPYSINSPSPATQNGSKSLYPSNKG
jgi:hypothetical protein